MLYTLARGLTGILATLSVCAAVAAPPKYKLTRIPRLGYLLAQGDAINNQGDVMGVFYTPGQRAFLYRDGVITDIYPLPGQTGAFAMNNKGHIVGGSPEGAFLYKDGVVSYLSNEQYEVTSANDISDAGHIVCRLVVRPCIYHEGVVTLLPTGPFSELFAGTVNKHGQSAGGGVTSEGERAYLYSNGTTTSLGSFPNGGQSFGLKINASGQVMGRGITNDGHQRAFLYSNGEMIDLGTLGGDAALGLDMNGSGAVTGGSQLANGTTQAFIYRNGAMTKLNVRDAAYSFGYFITDNEIVVGEYGKADGTSSFFVYGLDGKTSYDLHNLISDSDPFQPFVTFYELAVFGGVNGLGQVLAHGIDSRTGRAHTYIASPIDSTKPVVTPITNGTRGTNGWFTSDVSLRWSISDDQAPIADTTGCKKVLVAIDTVGKEFVCKARSIGGLATERITVKRDTSLPKVALRTPANLAVFDRNQVVVADYTCSDAPSGIAACIGTVADGARIDTSSKVTNATFRVKATDKAGISRTVTRTYSVR